MTADKTAVYETVVSKVKTELFKEVRKERALGRSSTEIVDILRVGLSNATQGITDISTLQTLVCILVTELEIEISARELKVDE